MVAYLIDNSFSGIEISPCESLAYTTPFVLFGNIINGLIISDDVYKFNKKSFIKITFFENVNLVIFH